MKKIEVRCPIGGKIIPLSKVKDEAFSSGVLGEGLAIQPENGKVVSPIDGTVDMVANAKHALNLVGDHGEEILIHFGIDTVTLKGKPFAVNVQTGDKVKTGDLLFEADISAIEQAGLDLSSPIVLLNPGDFKGIKLSSGKVKPGDVLFTIKG